MTDTPPEVVTFQIKSADAGILDIGSIALSCEVDWDHERNMWRAWDDADNEAWADWKPLAAARLFVQKFERIST